MVSLKVLPTEKKSYPVLGTFEKGIDGSRSINFCTSGGTYCDRKCAYHPNNKSSAQQGRCYAVRIEHRFDHKQLLGKLVRHEHTDPAELVERALLELQLVYAGGNKVPWLRFSTSGSVPGRRHTTKRFKAALIAIMDFCDEKNIPVHLPIETFPKTRFYRQIVGSRCVVRESVTSEQRFVAAAGPVSVVTGTMDMTQLERIAACKSLAARRTAKTGRKVIVCPAVAARYLTGSMHATSKAKCGNCVSCALPDRDVIFPLH